MANEARDLAREEIDKIAPIEENFEDDIAENEEDLSGEKEYLGLKLEDEINTHQKIKKSLCGSVVSLEESRSETMLQTTDDMVVDTMGLIHNGFIYGAAEYAAILAINEVNLVTISSKVKFLAPAKNGDIINFNAKAKFEDLRKREVKVIGEINEIKIFEGIFQAVVLENHVLKTKLKNINKNYHAK